MEYLDGAPLATLLEESIASRTPLPLGGLARLTVEVLDALGAAHAKNIVHRDLKPDNIYVAPSGRPKVLDFGIAKLSDGGIGSATRTGSLLGTPHYMSPEQAAGKVVDHRADIYAMGVILYECVTGTKLFQADSLFDLLRKQVEEPAPSPRLIRPDLSPEFEAVILTALAKAPEQRFSTAQAMSMALQHATSQLPAEAWVPISGSGAHRSQVGAGSLPPGWQPTPPASWGGSPPSQPPGERVSHAVPRPSEPAPHFQQKHSTVSASSGQVQQQGKKQGGKGLWIGLAAVALIGGGVTAAVVLSGSGGDDGSVAKADPPPEGEKKAATDDKKADDKKPDDKKADDKKADDKKADDKKPEQKADTKSDEKDDDDTDDAELADAMKGLPKDVQAELEKVLADAPPEIRKQMKVLGDLSKLSPAERNKKIKEMQRTMLEEAMKGANVPPGGGGPTTGGGGPVAKAKAPPTGTTPPTGTPDDNNVTTSPPVTAPPVTAPPSTGWVESRPLAPPPGWDPKRADPAVFIRYAISEAKKAVPDAVLIRVEVDGVSPDGRADLTLPTLASSHGSIELRFISPSRAKRDPKIPVGVPVKWACQFRIEAEPDGVTLRPINGFDCSKEQPIAAPRCSPLALWKRAIATRKPPTNAVATMSFYGWMGSPARWHFNIGFGTDVAFSETFDDGC
jgi:serine/threonine-protein kinase